MDVRVAVPKAPGLTVVNMGGLDAAALSPVRYVISPILPRGYLTVFGGHGGAGKSLLALTFGAHVAAGKDWGGFPTIRGRVVYLTLEDSGELARWRLAQICRAYQVDIDNNVTILDGSQFDAALFRESQDRGRVAMETPLLHQLRGHCANAALIVIDNASDAFDADENSRRQVRAFLRALSLLAKECDAAVMLLAHIDKVAARNGSAGNSYSGSTAWHNSARSRIALVQSETGLEFRHEKLNLGPRAQPLLMRFDEHGILWPASFSAKQLVTSPHVDELLLTCLQGATERGEIIGAARSGPGNAHTALRRQPGFPMQLSNSDAFWTVMNRMAQSRRIVRV